MLVQSFRYLGSFVESHGEVTLDDDDIAGASKAFGALRKFVFGTALYQDKEDLKIAYC